jgi:Rad3-related DNA helicase
MSDVERLLDSVVADVFPSFQWRPNQKEAVMEVLTAFLVDNYTKVVLDAPTGAGKSWIARIIAECLNRVVGQVASTLFLTKTISLQNQYLRDFPSMKKLMGASNYSCHTDNPPAILPAHKHHTSCKYSTSDGQCEYNIARSEYKAAPLKTLNYAFYFTGYPRYAGVDTLIVDECHNLPDFLIDYTKVEFNLNRINEMTPEVTMTDYFNPIELNKRGLQFSDLPEIYEFIRDTQSAVQMAFNELMDSIENMPEDSKLAKLLSDKLIPLEKDVKYLQGLGGKLLNMASQDKSNLVIDSDENESLKFSITPIFIPDYAMEILDKSTFTLLMSATPFLMVRELDRCKVRYKRVIMPYSYPVEHRPFIIQGEMPKINHSTRQQVIQEYVEQVDKILDQATESGLIHSSSYSYAEDVLKYSRHRNRLYIPRGEELRNIKSVVRPGRVLVSPSLIEGVDFAGDMAEFQIILKVPYPALGDNWIKTKMDVDEGWYDAVTITNIIQASGRPIRSAEDVAVTICLDPSFKWLLNRVRNDVPSWFMDSVSQ